MIRDFLVKVADGRGQGKGHCRQRDDPIKVQERRNSPG